LTFVTGLPIPYNRDRRRPTEEVSMALTIGWPEIALRLTLTLVAGGLIGLNRAERGRPAGLRTMMLVCLAASLAMIQANLLLGTEGKPAGSLTSMDVLRLPLGILSGMGFIGGGAILKRGDIVVGVTTAATLWFVTVVGLCFGGGQILLGIAALVIGLAVLWGFKWFELLLPHVRRGTLIVITRADGPTESEIRRRILATGYHISSLAVAYDAGRQRWQVRCMLEWRSRSTEADQPALFEELARLPGVARLRWRPEGMPI
jgi:putative Mg2+ transporter-C (MgtC) family protein